MDIKTGQFATVCFDPEIEALYCLYVTDDMLFGRRYPSLIYTDIVEEGRDAPDAFDGFNIVKPPELVLPTIDSFLNNAIAGAAGGSAISAMGGMMGLSAYFGLPALRYPGEVIDTFEADYRSIKTKLKNEKDPGGLPTFLVGNREGALINGFYPYPSSYVFNESTSVAQSKPAAYITRRGEVRFFYADLNGNINAGVLNAQSPIIDTKRKAK